MSTPTPFAEIIGFDSGWGCADFRCQDGPSALHRDALLYALAEEGVKAKWRGPMGLKFLAQRKSGLSKDDTLPQTLEALRRLSAYVRLAIETGHVPVVVGGDHSSAIGTWGAAAEAKHAMGNFGLVWIDAHMDAHTYETSSQGKWGGWWHGQPVAALTGHGLPEFTHLNGHAVKISPRHLSLIGPHSFEPAEKDYVEAHGIRVYPLEEVRDRGFKPVFDEALARARDGTAAFGLSIDLDAFRPEDAPGVGTAEKKGLNAADVLPILSAVGRLDGFTALEIAEFNPHNDVQGKTRKLAEDLIKTVFARTA